MWKKDMVSISFDLMKRPKSIIINDIEHRYKQKQEKEKIWTSELKAIKENGLTGLLWNNEGRNASSSI